MRITTIQPKEVYNICKNKTFYTDITKSEYYHDSLFINAYQWLIVEMNKRFDKPKNAEYPVWGWYRFNGKSKLDLRYFTKIHESGTYEIVLDVPDDQVLLTDFEKWHYVLNDWYLPSARTDEEYEKLESNFEKSDKLAQDSLKKESWNNVFNFDKNAISDGLNIQATFWKIEPEWIVNARTFGSKPPIKYEYE